MSEYRDIVIAGGGMVGVSLALQLAQVLPEQVTICLVEGFPFPEPVADGPPQYHPSFDARSTALSYSSQLIFEKMGVWEGLKQWLCSIESIHVSNSGRFGSTLMRTEDYGWPALGYVVENAWMGNALIQALYRQGKAEVRSSTQVVDAAPNESGVTLQLTGEGSGTLDAALLLVADGASSGLREKLGVGVQEKPYRQHALVTNVAFAKAHEGCAYERFTRHGPLALLPLLPVQEGGNRSALVWTVSLQESEELMAASDEDFLRALQERFGYRLGRMQHVGERYSYPLSLVQASEQVRQGIVVMGNAAHALHPVAGQGFNLALRDVAELANTLAEGVEQGLSVGDLSLLQRYERNQRVDQERTIEFSDRLPSLFMQTDPVLGLARDLALSGLDILPPLKRDFVRYAAGVADMGEQLSG